MLKNLGKLDDKKEFNILNKMEKIFEVITLKTQGVSESHMYNQVKNNNNNVSENYSI